MSILSFFASARTAGTAFTPPTLDGLFDVHVIAADHRANHGAFVFAIGLAFAFDFAAFIGSETFFGSGVRLFFGP